jgi:potassium/hydrogen antiporter
MSSGERIIACAAREPSMWRAQCTRRKPGARKQQAGNRPRRTAVFGTLIRAQPEYEGPARPQAQPRTRGRVVPYFSLGSRLSCSTGGVDAHSIVGEPRHTAAILAAVGGLLALSVLLSRAIGRRGLPVVVLFLVLGMLAGSEGIGRIEFENYGLTFRLGTVALALILFDGGLNTPLQIVRQRLASAATLATAGVLLTTGVVGLCGRWLGFSWTDALLLGAIVSSTDAAAVFSILRGSGLQLKERVGATLELESGLNDPMSVILTIGFTRAIVEGSAIGAGLALEIAVQLAVGAAAGVAIGYLGRWVLRQPVLAGGLYPVLTLALCALAFGIPTLFFGSGFLSVYVAGVILGGGRLPYRSELLRVHDFLAWFAQIMMFVALGLLVFPSRLLAVAGSGLAVAAVLAFVARPLAVALCLLPFRFRAREIALVGWVGLRGAVPIILATFPILAGAPSGARIFDIVFFVVVVSALIQGGTVRLVTRALGLEARTEPVPPTTLEIASNQPLSGDLLSFYMREASAACGAKMSELPFPEGAAAMLIVRGRELIAPRGGTQLRAGDHVYVFCRPEDRGFMQLLFGPSGEE